MRLQSIEEFAQQTHGLLARLVRVTFWWDIHENNIKMKRRIIKYDSTAWMALKIEQPLGIEWFLVLCKKSFSRQCNSVDL